MDKITYIEEKCEIFEEDGGFYVDTGGIVGNFCGRAIFGSSKEEAVLNALNYFHEERYYEKDTMVKDILKSIGW
jgi:hypothetical protein